jgi:hypothetical protein
METRFALVLLDLLVPLVPMSLMSVPETTHAKTVEIVTMMETAVTLVLVTTDFLVTIAKPHLMLVTTLLAKTVDLVTTTVTVLTLVLALVTTPESTVNARVIVTPFPMIPTFSRLNGLVTIIVKMITRLDVWEVLLVFTNREHL